MILMPESEPIFLLRKDMFIPAQQLVSTDSHANILGAVGAFGQGMGDMDIAAAWHNGKVWFKSTFLCKDKF